jgi:hypothetical protein
VCEDLKKEVKTSGCGLFYGNTTQFLEGFRKTTRSVVKLQTVIQTLDLLNRVGGWPGTGEETTVVRLRSCDASEELRKLINPSK